jgi:hypothetical protein
MRLPTETTVSIGRLKKLRTMSSVAWSCESAVELRSCWSACESLKTLPARAGATTAAAEVASPGEVGRSERRSSYSECSFPLPLVLELSRRAAAFLRRFPTRLRPEEVSEVESSVEEATSEPLAVDERRRLRLSGTG